MTKMLELEDKDFKTAIIYMILNLKEITDATFTQCWGGKSWQRNESYKKALSENSKTEKYYFWIN